MPYENVHPVPKTHTRQKIATKWLIIVFDVGLREGEQFFKLIELFVSSAILFTQTYRLVRGHPSTLRAPFQVRFLRDE